MKRTITLNLRAIIGSMSNLRELSGMEFSATVSYKLARAMRTIDEEVTAYQEALEQAREKYAANPDAPAKEEMGWIDDTAKAKYLEEANELLGQEIEMRIPQVNISDLKKDVKPTILVDCYYLFENFNDDYEEEEGPPAYSDEVLEQIPAPPPPA